MEVSRTCCRLREIWRGQGLGAVCLAAIPLLIILQFIRPFFFLTDDNLALGFPIWVYIGKAIWQGQNPFVCSGLFGVEYPLFQDPSFIGFWHPVSLLLSLLAPTFLRNAIIDLYAMIYVLWAAVGMRYLLGKMEEESLTQVSARAQLFLSLSYAFSMYSLLIGSSSACYLANVASLPWLVGALWEKNTRLGFWIIGINAFNNAVSGYPSAFAYSTLLWWAILLWKTWHGRDGSLLARSQAALVVAGIFSLPMILPSLLALNQSVRPAGIPVEIASEQSLPFLMIFSSLFGGMGYAAIGAPVMFGKFIHSCAILSFAGAGLSLAAFFRKRSRWSSWDVLLLLLLGGVILLVARPLWVAELIHQIPLLRGFRWPWKESFLIVFLLHLWAARGSDLYPRMTRWLVALYVLLFFVPFILGGPPSLNERTASRRLLFNGEADRYWRAVRAHLQPGQMIAPIHPHESYRTPDILSGACNFPVMFEVKSWSGYSATLPRDLFFRTPRSADAFGFFLETDRENLLRIPGVILLGPSPENPWQLYLEDGNQKVPLPLPHP